MQTDDLRIVPSYDVRPARNWTAFLVAIVAILFLFALIATLFLCLGILAVHAQSQTPAAQSTSPEAMQAQYDNLGRAYWAAMDGKDRVRHEMVTLGDAVRAMDADAFLWPGPAVQATYRFHGGAALNDLTVTPGAIGAMTTAQLCDKSFHTGTVRNVTEAAKQEACRRYGIARADCTGKKYEIDHLISLELGGSNDIANLWPQPYFPKPAAKEKDVVENWLHAQVCSARMTLPQAQHAISTDWYQVFLDINGAPAQAGGDR